jgi:hypothetical protein
VTFNKVKKEEKKSKEKGYNKLLKGNNNKEIRD